MTLFCTKSLKYSREVPAGIAGLAPLTTVDSECSDCTSSSLGIIDGILRTVADGVAEDGYAGIPAETEMLPPDGSIGAGEGEGVVEFELDLNDERRFCADDFRRMVGRCISGAATLVIVNVDWLKLLAAMV